MNKEYDTNCVFCKIVDGIIPSNKIYEDDDVLAFLDVNPVTKGHALVVSKKHYETFLSTPKEVMNKVMNVAQRIGQIDITVLGAKGINVITNCYPSAGQSVPHFHVHVIPRYDATDGFKVEYNTKQNINLPSVLDTFIKELNK